jgi:hypothetical protein
VAKKRKQSVGRKKRKQPAGRTEAERLADLEAHDKYDGEGPWVADEPVVERPPWGDGDPDDYTDEDEDIPSGRRGKAPEQARDPFVVIGEIPRDKAYQWVAFAIRGDETLANAIYKGPMSKGGWHPVSPSMHPSMPSVNGCIEVLGQVLMQRSKEKNDYARALAEDTARYIGSMNRFLAEENVAPFMPPHPWQAGGGVETAEDIEGRAAYAALPEQEKLKYVMVQIGIEVRERDAETAANLKLNVAEYMKRRVYMDTRGLERKSGAIFNSGAIPIFSTLHFYDEGKQDG